MIFRFKDLLLILISVSVPMVQGAIQDVLIEMIEYTSPDAFPVEADQSQSNYIENISENIINIDNNIVLDTKKDNESIMDQNEDTDEESDKSQCLDDPDFDPTRFDNYVQTSPTSSSHSEYRPPKCAMTEQEFIPGKLYFVHHLLTKNQLHFLRIFCRCCYHSY